MSASMSAFKDLVAGNQTILNALNVADPGATAVVLPAGASWSSKQNIGPLDFSYLCGLSSDDAAGAAAHYQCVDTTAGPAAPLLTGTSVLDCSMVKNQCALPNGTMVRMLCPRTCSDPNTDCFAVR